MSWPVAVDMHPRASARRVDGRTQARRGGLAWVGALRRQRQDPVGSPGPPPSWVSSAAAQSEYGTETRGSPTREGEPRRAPLIDNALIFTVDDTAEAPSAMATADTVKYKLSAAGKTKLNGA